MCAAGVEESGAIRVENVAAEIVFLGLVTTPVTSVELTIAL